MAGCDFGILVVLSQLVTLDGDILYESLDGPCYQLWGGLLDLANLLVCLHDLLDAVQWQFLSIALLHRLIHFRCFCLTILI